MLMVRSLKRPPLLPTPLIVELKLRCVSCGSDPCCISVYSHIAQGCFSILFLLSSSPFHLTPSISFANFSIAPHTRTHHHHHTCTLASPSNSLTSTPYTHWNLSGLQRKRCLKHTHILSVENAGRRALTATHLLCHITPWVGLMGGFCSVRSQTVGRI